MGASALPMPPRPPMQMGLYGLENGKLPEQLKVNEEITISTVTGSIGRTELSQVVNGIMAQVKASMETPMGMIHPESRFVQCLNERDNRLKNELDERDKKLRDYITQVLQNVKPQPQQTPTEVDTDEKGISTEIKDRTKQAMATMEEAHKAINFDQYLETGESETKEGNALTPNTKALEEQCAATPLKQSWEEALDEGGTTKNQLRDGNESNSEAEAKTDTANEGEIDETSSKINGPSEEQANETNPSQEVNDEANGTKSTQISVQQSENDDNNAQENPPPISNASHNYSEGLPGGDASSTASDEMLGLDTESINQSAKTKSTKRRSERVAAKLPSTKETTEKDAT
eukprot:scaffold249307_cov47-Cyclotella_meneghiniana.AAC.2